jgi:uncharacterized SAM-binding protein YcdF (DUF218 family)
MRGKLSRNRIILLGSVIAFSGLFFFALRHLGQWLELDEPLRHSGAIVVVGGGVPFRAMEAATLYHSGWAPEVWLTQGLPHENDLAMERLGIPMTSEHELSRLVLLKLGVPPSAIQVVPGFVDNTVAELAAIRSYAQSRSPGALILVSSKYHARRIRTIWNSVAPADVAVIVRYPAGDGFDAQRWWRTTTDALATFREAFGILNAWAGFPIAPRER